MSCMLQYLQFDTHISCAQIFGRVYGFKVLLKYRFLKIHLATLVEYYAFYCKIKMEHPLSLGAHGMIFIGSTISRPTDFCTDFCAHYTTF